LKKEEKNIELNNCNCQTVTTESINAAVDAVVRITGSQKDKVIIILQEVKKKLNYLPSEALKRICEVYRSNTRAAFRRCYILHTIPAPACR
jgi:hypothetical protein